jgi:hypothetical protein
MKNLFRIVSLVMVLVLAACVVAFADPATGGIYDLTVNLGTVTPKTAANGDIAAAPGTSIGGNTYTFYADAARLAVEFTGVADAQYMVFLIEADGEAVNCPTPTEANIKYVNQAAGAALNFNVYPSRMTNGKKYFLVLTCSADDSVGLAHPLATFKYFAAGVAVTGTVTGNELTGTVAYQLTPDGEDTPIASGTGTNVELNAIPDGSYTFTASLTHYVPHSIDVTVAGVNVELGDIELRLWGDVDNDGFTDGFDAVQILRYEAGLTTVVTPGYIMDVGDVDQDTYTDGFDAVQILRYEAGLTNVLSSLLD